MSDFVSLEWFGSAVGMVAFVATMVEVCKFFVPVNINPKWYCLGWSFVAMTVNALWINPAATPAEWFAAMVNALLVAAAATGSFEFAIKPIEQKIILSREAAQQQENTSDEAGEDV